MLSFFPRDVLDEVWDLIESISEGFPIYSSRGSCNDLLKKGKFAYILSEFVYDICGRETFPVSFGFKFKG